MKLTKKHKKVLNFQFKNYTVMKNLVELIEYNIELNSLPNLFNKDYNDSFTIGDFIVTVNLYDIEFKYTGYDRKIEFQYILSSDNFEKTQSLRDKNEPILTEAKKIIKRYLTDNPDYRRLSMKCNKKIDQSMDILNIMRNRYIEKFIDMFDETFTIGNNRYRKTNDPNTILVNEWKYDIKDIRLPESIKETILIEEKRKYKIENFLN